jgi:glycosyltransferase involved in cell wall biosynthesis
MYGDSKAGGTASRAATGIGATDRYAEKADADGANAFPILVHSHLRWDFVWQRPQQVFSRLAPHHRILFMEEPLLVQGSEVEGGEPRLRITEPLPNILRVVPLVGSEGDLQPDRACERLLPVLKHALDAHPALQGRFENPVQWFYSPMTAPGFLGRFGERTVVYDCMDELANFRFAPADIGEREALLLSRASLVFTGGYELYRSKSRSHGHVRFYGCGVDSAHFARARDPLTRVPDEIAALPQPVLGYFGVIDERIDYGLLRGLAERFPQGSIAMVGPVAKVDPGTLPSLPNIHWLGPRDYSQLPEIVKGFDVCLMPFALNAATRYINPTKTLEYMAAGKPIVSTAVPDVVRNFTPVVAIAHDHRSFGNLAATAWRHPERALIAEGIERARKASWDAIVADMRRDMIGVAMPRREASPAV